MPQLDLPQAVENYSTLLPMMSPPLLLASASPRRRELLTRIGVAFDVLAGEVDESPLPGEAPEPLVRRLARAKAAAVAERCAGAVVLAADTIVTYGGEIYGKPGDAADACRMLRSLSGRAHRVLTGFCVVGPQGEVDEVVVASEVEFRQLAEAEIDAYVATGEPLDKAGAYAIQGGASVFVASVRGSYSNIVGLPLHAVATVLARHLPVTPAAFEVET